MLGIALMARAGALSDLGLTAEALPVNTEAIAIFRKSMAPDDRVFVTAEGVQAALLLANGKSTDAERLATHVVELRSKPGAVDSPWRLGAIKSVLGGALAAHERFTEAEPLLVEGFRIVDADTNALKRRRSDALERVIRLYESWGKADEAAKWRARRPAPPGP